jgi:hypothetical protein
VQAASESEGLEIGMGIGQDAAVDVVVEALRDLACLGIDDESWAAEVVVDDAVGAAGLEDDVGDVRERAVDVDGLDGAVGVEACNRAAAHVGEEPLELAVDELGDAAVGAVDEVLDRAAVGELGAEQVAEFVVVIGLELARERIELAREVARVGVREHEAAVRDEAVLGVVRGGEDRDASLAALREVAVGVVEQLTRGLALLLHVREPVGVVVVVRDRVGLAGDELIEARDAAEGIALVGGLVERLAGEGRREALGLGELADVEVGLDGAGTRDVGQAGLGIALDGERTGLDQMVVCVVAVLDGGCVLDRELPGAEGRRRSRRQQRHRRRRRGSSECRAGAGRRGRSAGRRRRAT